MLQYVVSVEQGARGAPPETARGEPLEAARGELPEAASCEPCEGARRARAGRATVGGVEYAVGGWGGYEIGRRRERWAAGGAAAGRPGALYAGRSYVHAGDAVLSVLAASRAAVGGGAGAGARPSALQRAALRLADVLARMEDRLCDPDEDGVWECGSPSALSGTAPFALTIPPVTSADLRAFAASPAQQDTPEDLEDLGDDVLSLVAAAGAREGAALLSMPSLAARGRPPLPTRAVPVSDDEAVLRLEAAVAPYVASVEQLQAALASRLDAAASAISATLARRPAP